MAKRGKKVKGDYVVYVGGRCVRTVKTESAAWRVIERRASLFTRYEVRNAKGEVRPEFIPY